jgi:hypothetical protein
MIYVLFGSYSYSNLDSDVESEFYRFKRASAWILDYCLCIVRISE